MSIHNNYTNVRYYIIIIFILLNKIWHWSFLNGNVYILESVRTNKNSSAFIQLLKGARIIKDHGTHISQFYTCCKFHSIYRYKYQNNKLKNLWMNFSVKNTFYRKNDSWVKPLKNVSLRKTRHFKSGRVKMSTMHTL